MDLGIIAKPPLKYWSYSLGSSVSWGIRGFSMGIGGRNRQMEGKVISPRSEWGNEVITSGEDLSQHNWQSPGKLWEPDEKYCVGPTFGLRRTCATIIWIVCGSWEQYSILDSRAWVQVPLFYLLATWFCMSHASGPRFPHLYNKDNNCVYFIKWIWRLSELSKHRAWKSAWYIISAM